MTSERRAPIPTLKTGLAHPHPDPISGTRYSPVELMPGDRRVLLLDQRKLPLLEHYEYASRVEEVAEAIRSLVVRGAPAIGIAAAYGMVLAAAEAPDDADAFGRAIAAAEAALLATRPTARNLAWALGRMRRVALDAAREPRLSRTSRVADEARRLHADEVAACRKIGAIGAEVVAPGATILTHCNAGALATGGYGTALGIVRAAHAAGKDVRVIATETRPVLQGARLTAWELARDGIPVEIVTDSAVAHFMAKGAIDLVVVGADRIARSGDVANKIGTYAIACLASMHGVPFYVAAPRSTIDLECPDGAAIPIEERGEREVTHVATLDGEVPIAPDAVHARNPAFDVTPARYVRALFTEAGIASPLSAETLAAL